MCAEFNFAMDPESAYVVLEEFVCPTYVATWEYSCRNSLPWVRFRFLFPGLSPLTRTASPLQEFFEELISQDAPAAAFMKTITSKCWAYSKEAMRNKRDVYFKPGFVSYDAYAMAACVDAGVVTEAIRCPVRVELQGSICRGMMALDRTGELKKSHSVHVLTKCDTDKFARLLLGSVQQPQLKPPS